MTPRIVSQKFRTSDGAVTVTLTTAEGGTFTLPIESNSYSDIAREIATGIGEIEGWLK